MNKKKACQMIAGLVSVCAVVSLVTTVRALLAVQASGGTFPQGMLMITVMTALCTVFIWRGVMHMEDE